MAARILFIDDDRAGAAVALHNLRKAGYEVVPAADGLEGLALFSSGRFDLVITDIRMPGISGLEVLRRIREAAPDLPAIVITAYSDMETAIEAMREAARYFIVKPFDRSRLLQAVTKALERTSPADEAAGLPVPPDEVDRRIVCLFPEGGGSLRLGDETSRAGPPEEDERG